jgi:RNA polymerase sigma-70 factor (ECF subfamily)
MRSSEQNLLARVKASDKAAFEALFHTYQPILFRQIWYKSHDTDLAQDIVQETFVRVWQHRTSLKPTHSFLTYIVTISMNVLKDHWKREDVRLKYRDDVPRPSLSEHDHPEESLRLRLLEERITDIVNEYFPDRCRTIFILSRIDGKTNAEIAHLLHISQKTVENQLYHALKVLRRQLAEFL